MVVDWLERFADLSGIKVIATSNAGVLARVVQDFHEHVKGEKPHVKAIGSEVQAEGEVT